MSVDGAGAGAISTPCTDAVVAEKTARATKKRTDRALENELNCAIIADGRNLFGETSFEREREKQNKTHLLEREREERETQKERERGKEFETSRARMISVGTNDLYPLL